MEINCECDHDCGEVCQAVVETARSLAKSVDKLVTENKRKEDAFRALQKNGGYSNLVKVRVHKIT